MRIPCVYSKIFTALYFHKFQEKTACIKYCECIEQSFYKQRLPVFCKNDVLNFLRKLSVVKIQTVMICQAPIKML